MIIALIGMSNSGKSYWSKKLEVKGFKRFCCDDLIEAKLEKELKSLGYSGIQDVAKWMGQPFDKQYKKTSKKYLKFEKEAMEEIFLYLKKADQKENIVIDTTGSVIYTGDEILERLAKISKIIYLHTPSVIQKQMYEIYMQNPKPVIWGDVFSREKKEDNLKALARSYPKLLEFRVKKYKEISEVIFDYYLLRNKIFDDNLFFEVIKKYDSL